NPTTNAFSNYGDYAAMTSTGLSGADTPVRLYARTGVSASLLNSTSPFTQFTGATPTLSTAMAANTDYRGTLTLQNTGGGVNVSYTLRDVTTGNVVMAYSATQAEASFTQFDTAAFFLSKNATSPNYNFIIKAVGVSHSGGNLCPKPQAPQTIVGTPGFPRQIQIQAANTRKTLLPAKNCPS